MANRIDFSKIKIEIQLRNKAFMKGQAAIDYQGIRITHFRFMEDNETHEIYVEFPSLRVFKKYQRMIWIPNDEDHIDLEKELLKEYYSFKKRVESKEVQTNLPIDEIFDEIK